MQLTYVFSELRTGLRRNVSMTIAVIVTLFVSLTLVGLGLLLNAQANKAEEFWGDRLQITVFLCTENSPTANCIDGQATDAQKAAVEKVLETNPEVEKYHFETSQEAYDKWRAVYSGDDETQQQVIDAIRPERHGGVLLDHAQGPARVRERQERGQRAARASAPSATCGEVLQPIYFWISAFKWGAIVIAGFLLFAAILQVGNTIRLAAFARRKEIGIMRLVGASSLYIQLPFLLEALFAAVVGVLLAAGRDQPLPVRRRLPAAETELEPRRLGRLGRRAAGRSAAITVVGLALTLIPTLLLTRKYLKV